MRPSAYLKVVVPVLLSIILLTGGADARCFGVPEETEEEPSWSLGLRVESSHGLWNLAYLGIDSRATAGFDPDFDAVEPIFERGLDPQRDTLGLFLYFFYPENRDSAQGVSNPDATVALTRSVVPPCNRVTWPLRVAYFFPGETVLTLFWSPQAVRDSGFEMDLILPSGERVSMTSASTYSFLATPGFYDFLIEAVEMPSPPLDPLMAVGLTAYAAVVGVILWLRRLRKRRVSRP
jgi:hypothetical protein